MNPSNPEPVNEWNNDSSWLDWPHGGLWKNPLDGQDALPVTDPTAVSSAMTDSSFDASSEEDDDPASCPITDHSSPITPSTSNPPSLFDVGLSLSLMDPLQEDTR